MNGMKSTLFSLAVLCRIVFVFAAFGDVCDVCAQINPQPGYIITLENDTIQGQIDFRLDKQHAVQCLFCAAGHTDFERYLPGEIYAYRFLNGGKFYVSREVELNGQSRHVFLEYLVNGIVSLYYLDDEAGEYYFWENTENGDFKTVFLARTYSAYATVPEEGQREQRLRQLYPAYEILRKSPKVVDKLWKSDVNKKTLTRLTVEYHEEVCTSPQACVQYEYKQNTSRLKLAFHVSAGMDYCMMVSSELEKEYGIKHLSGMAPTLRVGIDVPLPRVSRQLFLQTMLGISHWKADADKKLYDAVTHEAPAIDAETWVADWQFGAAYRLLNHRLAPWLRAGFLVGKLFGMDYSEPMSVFINAKDDNRVYMGGYFGVGVDYRLKHGALMLHADYKMAKHYSQLKLRAWELTLGYRF